ncbi:MAG: Gram-negative bacterial tonB protein [Syntrophorhabdus sp. PtaU1.Bin058]|nr:MAG: Gram-negative bacterial tonB protein [Syntrophorhabdus sp. PtaU1.Bin058]
MKTTQKSQYKGKKRSSSKPTLIITGAVILLFIGVVAWFVYLITTDKGGGGKKVFVATIDLVRPNVPDRPPPPPPKERPAEEAIQRKENFMAPQFAGPQAPGARGGDDKPAPSGPLGLDAEGGAGSDGFGLAGRKGQGRDIVTLGKSGGGGGVENEQGALMRRFASYNYLIQETMRKAVRRYLDEKGGIPRGKLEVIVQIVLNNRGSITEYKIVGSSGNHAMDEAVRESIKFVKMNEPPPQGIPRSMRVRITSQG